MFTKFKKVQVDALLAAVCEAGYTPYITVYNHPEAVLPKDYINNDMITLNISVKAVVNFHSNEDGISYTAGFGGKSFDVYVPYDAIGALYPKEVPSLGFAFPIVLPKEKPESVNTSKGHIGWHKTASIH
jgi:stringent starvation protein B